MNQMHSHHHFYMWILQVFPLESALQIHSIGLEVFPDKHVTHSHHHFYMWILQVFPLAPAEEWLLLLCNIGQGELLGMFLKHSPYLWCMWILQVFPLAPAEEWLVFAVDMHQPDYQQAGAAGR